MQVRSPFPFWFLSTLDVPWDPDGIDDDIEALDGNCDDVAASLVEVGWYSGVVALVVLAILFS